MWRIKFAELHRSLLKFDEKKWQSAIFADCHRSEPKKVSWCWCKLASLGLSINPKISIFSGLKRISLRRLQIASYIALELWIVLSNS